MDAQPIFVHAMRFYEAERYIRNSGQIGPGATNMVLPMLVMSSFSSELMLKCLLVLENDREPPRSHNLAVLYRQLKHRTQRRIERLWDEKARPKIEALCRTQSLPSDLPNALRKCADSFDRLRYGYEDPHAGKHYIGDFPWILHLYIAEIKPEWFFDAPSAAKRQDGKSDVQ